MGVIPEPPGQFDFKATIIANLLIQLLLIYLFCFVMESSVLPQITMLAIVMYWLMAALAWRRRHILRLLERLALRLGLGVLLPLSALLVFIWKQLS